MIDNIVRHKIEPNQRRKGNSYKYKDFTITRIANCEFLVFDDRGVEQGLKYASLGEAKNVIDQLVIDNGQFGAGA